MDQSRMQPTKQVTVNVGAIVEAKFYPRLTGELLRTLVQDDEARRIIVLSVVNSTGKAIVDEFARMRKLPQFSTAAIDGSLNKLQAKTFEYLGLLANQVAGTEVFPIGKPDDNGEPVTGPS